MIFMRDIQARVAAHFDVASDEMLSEGRVRRLARPRQVSMTLCRALTDKSRSQIARFHGKDPSTALHAERAVIARCEADAEFDREMALLARDIIRNPCGGDSRNLERRAGDGS